jgi:hypothetical protein
MAEFQASPAQGYFLSPAVEGSGLKRASHVFCGEHSIVGAWCPNCSKPLIRVMSLDAGDDRLLLDLGAIKTVPLLYCWTCELSYDTFYYRIVATDHIEIVSARTGPELPDFPYVDYPRSFEAVSVWLTQVSHEDQVVLRALNRGLVDQTAVYKLRRELAEPCHQIGGEPLLLQGPDDYAPQCPICREVMPHFAAFGNANVSPLGFAEFANIQMLFNLCRKCRIVAAINRTD